MAQTFKIVDGDWVANPATGRPGLISGSAKLKQDISEFFTIQVLPNGFGSGLEQLVGVVEVSPDIFTSITDKQIREGLSVFVGLIRSNSTIPRTAGERIVGMSNLLVSADPTNPTTFIFSVNIITENGLSTQHVNSISVS